MQYDSFANQLYQLSHYAFAFWLLFWVWPKLAFVDSGNDRLERMSSFFVKACCFYIVLGYLLVLTRLYEVLALIFIAGIIVIFPYLRGSKANIREQAVSFIRYRFYDALETGFRLKQILAKLRGKSELAVKKYRKYIASGNQTAHESGPRRRIYIWFEAILKHAPALLLTGVLAGACYIRFYDVVMHAAPPLADSYVALAWMKYIERRLLFQDGFYPAGFHIILAYLHKFSAIDQLYVLKDSGPVMTLLITFSFYILISRFTGNRYAGILAAAIYGWSGYVFLDYSWERQVGTNSQEFSLVFVLPAVYFAIRYLQSGARDKLTAMLAACCAAGFAHTLAYGYLAMGVACAVGAAICLSFKAYYKRSLWIAVAGVISAAASYAQVFLHKLIVLSKLTKTVDNDAVNEFLNGRVNVPPVPLTVWDYTAAAAIFVTLLGVIFTRKRREERLPEAAMVVFGISSFFLYWYGGAITHSEVISSRVGNLWGIGATLGMGMGMATLWRALVWIPWRRFWEPALCLVLLIFFLRSYHLQPIVPYKMEWESGVRQYLRIASEFRPKTWTIYSQDEGYDLVLGNGFHQFLQNFVDTYDPHGKADFPTRRGETEPDRNIAPNAFVYQEKTVFRVSESLSFYKKLLPKYEAREKANAEFEAWLKEYMKTHPRPKVYYEDEHLVIYQFTLDKDPLDNPDSIWNGPVPLHHGEG
ncbi:hypothetical protein O9H85_09385 [Paenibacillus filicis]|uniref:Glycosyltransferase RgtA/B/C/D-like domain-containing protein n=1 Tax=Paenibacillus gyeongsangnamensis TaxID=3388067 RepID=A0ABT4Q6X6_9BACL|nr:hypothetical protein [Paenibacillus filicis]MCZ8512621.1 hypothetical protein [Paenibacillus filicis]